jgi:hypothetical protein
VYGYVGGIAYSLDGLSAFRSKGCIVGVVVEGVDGACKFQHFLTVKQGKAANHFGQSALDRNKFCRTTHRRRGMNHAAMDECKTDAMSRIGNVVKQSLAANSSST